MLNDLYKLKRRDIRRGSTVFADAFQQDPVWQKILNNVDEQRVHLLFESAVRYGLRYGNIYGSSENLEGIAVWVSEKYADFSILRGILSGSAIPTMKLGMKKLLSMQKIFEPFETHRREYMKDKPYIYLVIIGIASEFQRRGFGRKLIDAVIKDSKNSGKPIYLETATEDNVKMYEHFGFEVLVKLETPEINLPQWVMFRNC